jgi:hypothetical protein
MSEESGFLSRWNRRKQAALRGDPIAEPAVAAPEPPAPELPAPKLPAPELPKPELREPELPAPKLPELPGMELTVPEEAGEALAAHPRPAEAAFDPASLPPIELLDAASDFSAFLKPGVPAALRSAALRKAWVADPMIRDYLSPLDYGWDFNAPGGLPFGFADTLGEGAGKVLQLIRQAVGEPEPPPEEGAPPLEPAPEAVPLEELPVAEPLMAESTEAIPSEAGIEAAEPLRRRHGGALPA